MKAKAMRFLNSFRITRDIITKGFFAMMATGAISATSLAYATIEPVTSNTVQDFQNKKLADEATASAKICAPDAVMTSVVNATEIYTINSDISDVQSITLCKFGELDAQRFSETLYGNDEYADLPYYHVVRSYSKLLNGELPPLAVYSLIQKNSLTFGETGVIIFDDGLAPIDLSNSLPKPNAMGVGRIPDIIATANGSATIHPVNLPRPSLPNFVASTDGTPLAQQLAAQHNADVYLTNTQVTDAEAAEKKLESANLEEIRQHDRVELAALHKPANAHADQMLLANAAPVPNLNLGIREIKFAENLSPAELAEIRYDHEDLMSLKARGYTAPAQRLSGVTLAVATIAAPSELNNKPFLIDTAREKLIVLGVHNGVMRLSTGALHGTPSDPFLIGAKHEITQDGSFTFTFNTGFGKNYTVSFDARAKSATDAFSVKGPSYLSSTEQAKFTAMAVKKFDEIKQALQQKRVMPRGFETLPDGKTIMASIAPPPDLKQVATAPANADTTAKLPEVKAQPTHVPPTVGGRAKASTISDTPAADPAQDLAARTISLVSKLQARNTQAGAPADWSVTIAQMKAMGIDIDALMNCDHGRPRVDDAATAKTVIQVDFLKGAADSTDRLKRATRAVCEKVRGFLSLRFAA